MFLDEKPANLEDGDGLATAGIPDPQPAEPLLPRGPMLLDPLPDAPTRLDVGWVPEFIVVHRMQVGAAFWLAVGLILLIGVWVVLSVLSFVLGLFQQSLALGIVACVGIGTALCMILYAVLLEIRAYRTLGNVERLRAVLAAQGTTVLVARAHAVDWLIQLGSEVSDGPTVRRLLEQADTVAAVRGILRNRVTDPLRERASSLRRRAAVEGATLVAVCPHPAWDGLIAGIRGLLLIRRAGALYGLRLGFGITLALLQRMA